MRCDKRHFSSGLFPILRTAACAQIVAVAFSANTNLEAAAEPVKIELPLDMNGAYEVDHLMEQCNLTLKTQYSVESYRGRKRSLSPADRAALLLAHEFGLIEVHITPERITLKLANANDAERLHQTRLRLRRLFKLPDTYWTENHGLRVPADFDSGRPTLLVIHGLEAAPIDLDPFVRACRATEIQLLRFTYPNDGPLADAGRRLNHDLDELMREQPGTRVAAVGLSMGGLVARYCLETPGMVPCAITDLFMVGTPNHGSALAKEYELLELVFQVAPRGLDGLRDALGDGFGEAANDLEPGSEFLIALNGLPRAAGIRYHLGIGSHSFIKAEQRERVLADVRRIMVQRGVPVDMSTQLIDLLSAEELRDGAADGAVTMKSARLSGCHSERVFPLNHDQLMSLPGARPEHSEVFQWILATMGWH